MSNHGIVHLAEANLQGSDMSGVNLQKAVLNQANLQGVNLKSANLQGANLWNINLRDANLKDANLRGAELGGAKLQKANMKDADISFTDLRTAIKLTTKQILSAIWGIDTNGHGEPPSLPEKLANDPEVQEWLAKPHFDKSKKDS